MQLPTPDPAESLAIARTAELTVKRKTEGMRLDLYLVSMFPDFSRSSVQKVIEAGGVTVNDVPAKASYKVRMEDRVRVVLPDPARPTTAPEDIPLTVLYEDDVLALVNKPFDMV